MAYMEKTQAQRRREALQLFMQQRGLNPNRWATAAGASESALRGFLSGRTESLNIDTYERLADAAGVPIDRLLPPRNQLMEGGRAFADHPDAAAAAEAREVKAAIVRAITDAPELFASLQSAYQQMYAEEGIAIAEAELAALVLDDYARLMTDFQTAEERRHIATGFAVKHRDWLRKNRDRIGA